MTLKRFIAGATCPQCGQMDTLYLDTEAGERVRACVSCEFHEVMRFENNAPEPQTRVNRQDADEEAVRMVDLPTDPSQKE